MIPRRPALALASILCAAAVALVGLGAPAGAQTYPGPPAITLDKTSVAQGGTVLVSCTGFMPDSDVQIILRSDPVDLGSYPTDGNGELSTQITIPPGTTLGDHSIECSGLDETGNPVTVVAQVTVTAAGTTPVTSGSLPRTGSDASSLVRIGVVLVVVGAAFAIAFRRRTASGQSTR